MDTKNWLENIVYACNIQRYATELILEIHFDCQKFIRSKNRENQMDQEPRRNKSNNPNKIKEKKTLSNRQGTYRKQNYRDRRRYQQRLHLRRLFHLAQDLGMVNLEKNSEKGRGGDDQSTSRRASKRSSAVTLPQSMAILVIDGASKPQNTPIESCTIFCRPDIDWMKQTRNPKTK